MKENIIQKKKIIEQSDEKELENYQIDLELAIENH